MQDFTPAGARIPHEPTTIPVSHMCRIKKDGTMRFIDSPHMNTLYHAATEKSCVRVSHVYPNISGYWYANMAPINGPVSPLFPMYEQAVAWEVAWLEKNYL